MVLNRRYSIRGAYALSYRSFKMMKLDLFRANIIFLPQAFAPP